LAEALGFIQALGLPLEKFVEAMQANASHSTTLAMKMPKMIQRDFEPHFSVKHMLKDMQIANQLGLSHYLDLGLTAAARDQLIEQIQWGHGDDDFSAVARKYLSETATVSNKQPQVSRLAVSLPLQRRSRHRPQRAWKRQGWNRNMLPRILARRRCRRAENRRWWHSCITVF
jgi:hypothetical protein